MIGKDWIRVLWTAWALTLLAEAPTWSAAQPIGSELTVHSECLDLAPGPDGGYVAFRREAGQGGSGPTRYLARLNALGQFIEPWKQLSLDPLETFVEEADFDVAVGSDGEFVVSWGRTTSAYGYGAHYGVVARKFDANGDALGAESAVASVATGFGGYDEVTRTGVRRAANDEYIVVWNLFSTAAGSSIFPAYAEVQARALDQDGVAIGPLLSASAASYIESRQGTKVATVSEANDHGEFLVVWSATPYGASSEPTDDPPGVTDLDGNRIMGRLLDEAGRPVGGPFQVNELATGSQLAPRSHAVNDGFLVTWDRLGAGGDIPSALLRLDGAGVAVAAEIEIASRGAGLLADPANPIRADQQVLPTDGGELVTVWRPQGATHLMLRSLDADGQPLSAAMQINEAPIAPTPSGSAVDRWAAQWPRSDGDRHLIFWCSAAGETRARMIFTGLFADGFESGGTATWAASTGEVRHGGGG